MYKEFYLINGKPIPKISGGKGGKGCFAKGTLIMTDQGNKPIENILPGDKVLSFDSEQNIKFNKVTNTFFHEDQEVLTVILWGGKKLFVTPNHWFLTENNSYKEIRHFKPEEALIGLDNQRHIITHILPVDSPVGVYNLTVENDHTYVANGIFAHNKGGGKTSGGSQGGSEADDTLFSTDLVFVLAALGEGPIYRVNPNGPQDIEINEGPIDDLLNLDGDGLINANLFYYTYNTGTLDQPPIRAFGDAVISPQALSNPVTLKKGNRPGVTAQRISYMSTTTGTAWDQLTFKFNIGALVAMDNNGNIFGNRLVIVIEIFNANATKQLAGRKIEIVGKASSAYKFDVDMLIPEEDLSTDGYKFNIKKLSSDSSTSKAQDSVTFYGWDEIKYGERAYPRTALVAYAISATSEYKGNIPTVTSMVKGLLCRVPSNYNQPILENGEVDWRQVEVGDGDRAQKGFFQQKTGGTIIRTANPTIYDGLWDGSFVYNWTQNPVWIIYEILTNKVWGLGILDNNIDKYNFYKVAQYCDAIDQKTGKFVGVVATADGTNRHKPRGEFTKIRETLRGLPNGTAIKERRFIYDALISSRKQIMDILNQITASFRGMLFYSAGKLTLNVDMPDELPLAVFNETNIIKDTLVISGMKESEIITGVDISFIDPLNHYKRETLRISDDNLLREVNHIENIKSIDLSGCTRRSEATRFAQYLLANGKYLRRKAQFKTSIEGLQLTAGNIISLSTRISGTSWGFAGRVFSNTTVNNNRIYLEHFTSPGITESVLTANTQPLALRVLQQDSDRVDYYLISNTSYEFLNTGNTHIGYDVVRVDIDKRFNPTTKTFGAANYKWQANTAPVRHDLWTLGEVDPGNIFTSQTDKLFKITNIERTDDHEIQITAIEYISNVYIDSETNINYEPVLYKDLSSLLTSPPAPMINLVGRPVREPDGSISYAVDINSTTDTSGYPMAIKTLFEVAYPDEIEDIRGVAYQPPAEYQFYFDAVIANGGTITEDRRSHLANLISFLQDSGDWNCIEDMWIFAAENQITAKTSIKQRRLASNVGPAITFKDNAGFRTNGSTTYIDTNWNVAADSSLSIMNPDNATLAIYDFANVSSVDASVGILNSSTSRFFIRPLRVSNLWGSINSGEAVFVLPSENSAGFSAIYRAPDSYGARKDTVTLSIATAISSNQSSFTKGNVFVGGYNNNGSLGGARVTNCAFIVLGNAYLAQSNTFYNAMKTYMATTGNPIL